MPHLCVVVIIIIIIFMLVLNHQINMFVLFFLYLSASGSVCFTVLMFFVSTHSSQGESDWKGAGLPEPPRQLPPSQCQPRQTLHDDGWAAVYPLWWLDACHPHFCLYARSVNASPRTLLSFKVFGHITPIFVFLQDLETDHLHLCLHP